MSQDDMGHLWRAFIHDTGSAAKTKDASKSDTFLNTSTFWLKVDVEHRATKCGSTVEALHKSIGSNLVNAADLIVLGGDSEVRTEVTVNRVLGLDDSDNEVDNAGVQDSSATATKTEATLELRQHLLQACKLQAPTMYAAYMAIPRSPLCAFEQQGRKVVECSNVCPCWVDVWAA